MCVVQVKIDTEGNDAAVLDGARDALCAGNTAAFLFEKVVAEGSSWDAPGRLENHMATFGSCGFDCYVLSGQRRYSRSELRARNLSASPNSLHVAKLTDGCWNPIWERLNWANIVCAHKSVAALHYFYESRRIRGAAPNMN